MLPGLMSLDFCCDIQMVGSEFGLKNMKDVLYAVLLDKADGSSTAAGGGVMVWGIFSWHICAP